jgi:hypothetical protein
MALIKKQIYSQTVTAGQNIVIPLTNLPYVGDLGPTYLRKFRFYLDASVNTGASGATSKMLHDLIASASLKVQGRYYGFKGLSGSQMTAIMASFGQRSKRFVTANGDTLVAATQVNQTRDVVIDWDFGIIGDQQNDFARPCAWFGRSGAELQITIAASVAANISSLTSLQLYIWVECDSKPEKAFSPWVLFEQRGVDTLTNGTLGRGRLLRLLAQNSGDWQEGDITNLTLYCNGTPILDGELPHLNVVDTPPRVASLTAQEAFINNMGGTANTLVFIPCYPQNADDKRVTKRPVGDYTFNVTGAETSGNITWVYGFLENFSTGEAAQAFAYMGEPVDNLQEKLGTREAAMSNLKSKTATKSPTHAATIGVLPVKLD